MTILMPRRPTQRTTHWPTKIVARQPGRPSGNYLDTESRMIVLPLINTLRAWRNRSRVNYEFNNMSDRQLADIGIARGDIDAVV